MFKLFVLFFSSSALMAQLPETDLWLFKLKSEKWQLLLDEGKNITSRKGYDNQPYFTPDDKFVLYVSIREDNQADVYSYNISKKISTQITKTKESEYSPCYTPDNKFISCVTVEADSTQLLWLYSIDGSRHVCYNTSIDSIGYYLFLAPDTLIYYKLTEPHSLRLYNHNTKEDKWFCDNPSRSFKKMSGNLFMYAIKDSLKIQYRIYNAILKRSDLYAVHESNNEDFVWNNQLGLIKPDGAKLLRYDSQSRVWIVLFDFSKFGIQKITRFAFDKKNKYLVVVDNN